MCSSFIYQWSRKYSIWWGGCWFGFSFTLPSLAGNSASVCSMDVQCSVVWNLIAETSLPMMLLILTCVPWSSWLSFDKVLVVVGHRDEQRAWIDHRAQWTCLACFYKVAVAAGEAEYQASLVYINSLSFKLNCLKLAAARHRISCARKKSEELEHRFSMLEIWRTSSLVNHGLVIWIDLSSVNDTLLAWVKEFRH